MKIRFKARLKGDEALYNVKSLVWNEKGEIIAVLFQETGVWEDIEDVEILEVD